MISNACLSYAALSSTLRRAPFRNFVTASPGTDHAGAEGALSCPRSKLGSARGDRLAESRASPGPDTRDVRADRSRQGVSPDRQVRFGRQTLEYHFEDQAVDLVVRLSAPTSPSTVRSSRRIRSVFACFGSCLICSLPRAGRQPGSWPIGSTKYSGRSPKHLGETAPCHLFEPSTAPIGQRAKRYGEPIYTYYRDSERPGIVAIRALLEEWFQELPEDERRIFNSVSGRRSNGSTGPPFLSCSSTTCSFAVGSRSNFILIFPESRRILISW